MRRQEEDEATEMVKFDSRRIRGIIDGTIPIDQISIAELAILKDAIDEIIANRVIH